jgi:hypothetical protein
MLKNNLLNLVDSNSFDDMQRLITKFAAGNIILSKIVVCVNLEKEHVFFYFVDPLEKYYF